MTCISKHLPGGIGTKPVSYTRPLCDGLLFSNTRRDRISKMIVSIHIGHYCTTSNLFACNINVILELSPQEALLE